MKNSKLTFCRVAVIGSVLLIAGGSYAVDEIITVTATVPAWAMIEPSTIDARITLDGRLGAADYNASLLTLSLAHNSAIGYTIDVKSANDGKLVGVFDETKSIPYLISYDSQAPIPLGHTPQNVGGAVTAVTGSATTPFIKNIDILISNEAANAATQQDYEDTITFTLTGI